MPDVNKNLSLTRDSLSEAGGAGQGEGREGLEGALWRSGNLEYRKTQIRVWKVQTGSDPENPWKNSLFVTRFETKKGKPLSDWVEWEEPRD
jgi:hypothetical protein